jgi:hypothetical protein
MTEPKEEVSSSPPKRDKFASMAAAAAGGAAGDAAASAAGDAAASAAPDDPRRDKLTALAVSAPQHQEHQPVATSEEKNELLKQRMAQRDRVLKDLQQAEGWTWNLLTLANKTASSLSTLDTTKEQVSELSKQYRDTLQNIHSILTPHASLVVAYQNHGVDKNRKEASDEEKKEGHGQKEIVNMYAAKVERKLAQERRNVLQGLLRLEQQRGEQASVDDELPVPASKGSTVGKRKR